MNYLEDIYILNNITRYSTAPTVHKETVAAHSFFVAAIVLYLADLYKFNVDRAVTMAVCHDMPEIELNDLPRGIAVKYPAIKKAFEGVKNTVQKMFPYYIQRRLAEYEARHSVESKIVKLADAMQCVQKANYELLVADNEYMHDVLSGARATIRQLETELVGVERE